VDTKGYFKNSSNPYYSIVAALPLLIGYEIILAMTNNPYWRVRNAADVWLREVILFFNFTSRDATFVMITIVFILIPFAHFKYGSLNWRYFFGILLESLIYSFLLGGIIHAILRAILLSTALSSTLLQNIALSLGAGLFEELFFRVLLLNALFLTLKPIIKKAMPRVLISIVIAAFLFSLSHYVGGLADNFEIYSFMFRFIAGLLFTIIYFIRGFAVAAYTHAFYDIWVFYQTSG